MCDKFLIPFADALAQIADYDHLSLFPSLHQCGSNAHFVVHVHLSNLRNREDIEMRGYLGLRMQVQGYSDVKLPMYDGV